MKYHFIINPKAGTGKKADELAQAIRLECDNAKVDYCVYMTKSRFDATEYVKNAVKTYDGPQRFYACGGDGTLGELINGAPNAENVEFGLIPIGTGNDFRRNFSDKEMFFDIKRQIEGESIKIDLMKYNDRYCINIINIGFDCNVVCEMEKIKHCKLVPNKLAYIAGIVVTLFKKMCSKIKISAENIPHIDRDLLLIAIANGKYYGGGFKAAPYSSLHDAKMDVSIIEKVSRLTFISLVGKYKKGEHLDTRKGKKCITYLKSDSLSLSFDSPKNICVDGEIEKAQNIDIKIMPSAASFIIPKGAIELERDSVIADDVTVVNYAASL